MANEEHLAKLNQGVEVWNRWRKKNGMIKPDLSEADLNKAQLCKANLREANLYGSNLHEADLREANLSWADLREVDLSWSDIREADLRGVTLNGINLGGADMCGVNLRGVNLSGVNLPGTNLTGADLTGVVLRNANLTGADLSGLDLHGLDLRGADLYGTKLNGANLNGANLNGAFFIKTKLERANLTECSIYGISTLDVNVTDAIQSHLIITPEDEPVIAVDNFHIAQFIYLLLNNAEIRNVIDTITSKTVLILGRFTPERKAILDTLREELRKRDYLPILFDFDKPSSRDLTETISTLAHMSRFIIADLTEAKSIPQELQAIVPNLPSVPVQPLILRSEREYAMFEHFKRYHWVLPIYEYDDSAHLLESLVEQVIAPAEAKAKELKA